MSKFSTLPIPASRTVATVGFPVIVCRVRARNVTGDVWRVTCDMISRHLSRVTRRISGIVSAKLDAGAALAASGALPENVNYAVKSRLLLSFLESVPDVSAKLKAPNHG